jgi:hypothetical protein
VEDQHIIEKFVRMGARATIRNGRRLMIDIRRDHRGEYFDITRDPDRTDLDIIDVRPALRHLLLLAREPQVDLRGQPAKHKFLCGHDERHWFAAAVPGRSGMVDVRTAFDALKPAEVIRAEMRAGVPAGKRNRRRNRAFVRQGEWFFVPAPEVWIPEIMVLRNEPLRRGSGKPHLVERCYRTGGETVYVSHVFPNGLSEARYRSWIADRRNPRVSWTVMRRNPGVYVCGRIRHPDHATVVLKGWHRVASNTEDRSALGRTLAFLD